MGYCPWGRKELDRTEQLDTGHSAGALYGIRESRGVNCERDPEDFMSNIPVLEKFLQMEKLRFNVHM